MRAIPLGLLKHGTVLSINWRRELPFSHLKKSCNFIFCWEHSCQKLLALCGCWGKKKKESLCIMWLFFLVLPLCFLYFISMASVLGWAYCVPPLRPYVAPVRVLCFVCIASCHPEHRLQVRDLCQWFSNDWLLQYDRQAHFSFFLTIWQWIQHCVASRK